MTPEEQLINRYFDAFNRHDHAGVMECFHAHPLIIEANGKRVEGRAQVEHHYKSGFEAFPDGRCDLWMCTGNNGHGVAESYFRATRPRGGDPIEASGAEVMEIVEGKIKEIRDYHQPSRAKAA